MVVNIKNNSYRLIKFEDDVKEILNEYACRMFTFCDLRYYLLLDPIVANAMEEHQAEYALTGTGSDTRLFYHIPAGDTYVVYLKYLLDFTSECVNVDVHGKTRTYFMTNKLSDIKNRLGLYGYTDDFYSYTWQVNAGLHENVKNRMAQLGAIFSLEIINQNTCVLNFYYEGEVPYVIYKNLSEKKFNQHRECCFLSDDIEKYKKEIFNFSHSAILHDI